MKEYLFTPKEFLTFSDKVSEGCRSCKRYGKKATCPPHCGTQPYYKNLLTQYKHGILVVESFSVQDEINYQRVGECSSLVIHDRIIELRNELFQKGNYFYIGFGAGSCKKCKTECSFPCRNPSVSLVPFEATGINVVALASRFGIEIEFPVKDSFYRVGAVFYD